MKKTVVTCRPQDDLATAARIMRDHHCGFLPVVDAKGGIAGVLTDRDVCVYGADRSRAMSRIGVKEIMSHPVFTCLPEENLKVTIGMMAKHHVRREPVIDRQGNLQGVVSIDDVIQAPHRRGGPTAEEIVSALKDIARPRPIETPAA